MGEDVVSSRVEHVGAGGRTVRTARGHNPRRGAGNRDGNGQRRCLRPYRGCGWRRFPVCRLSTTTPTRMRDGTRPHQGKPGRELHPAGLEAEDGRKDQRESDHEQRGVHSQAWDTTASGAASAITGLPQRSVVSSRLRQFGARRRLGSRVARQRGPRPPSLQRGGSSRSARPLLKRRPNRGAETGCPGVVHQGGRRRGRLVLVTAGTRPAASAQQPAPPPAPTAGRLSTALTTRRRSSRRSATPGSSPGIPPPAARQPQRR